MFDEKDQTKKKINSMDKRLIALKKIVCPDGESPTKAVDDPMFTNKPFGYLYCASCDSQVKHISGTRAQYNTWRNLPFKDPNERIASYG